ncbi:SIS domain-containing protein [Inquilinus sp. CAU 1745]|uniref:SIS domain-containing protein n=1 Tax=Inquilinus sp. CAU 1745 TaxID=3140369 RepID=UPI00325BC4C9
MLAEASETPRIVARQFERNADAVATLAERLRAAPPRFVVTGARGSSDHAATFAKYLIETRLGLVTASAAPSVATIYNRTLAMEGALFIAISQSGRSPDLIDMTERAKAGGALTVALVNDSESPLAAVCDTVLPLHAGAETSVAATKSYIGSLAALLHLTAAWTGDEALTRALTQLPGRLEEALDLDWSPMVDALADARDLLILGRGTNLAIAQEAALKLKETCGLHSEAFSAAEVMHGPVALVGQDYPVVVFSPEDETRASVRELAATIRAQGGRVLIAETEGAADRLPVPRPLHPACDSLPMILAFYRAAARLSVRRGLDPDEPRHLRKVTETR